MDESEDKTYYEIQDRKNLVRDGHSKAIVNTDKLAFENFQKMKMAKNREKANLENLKKRVESTEAKLDRILEILEGKPVKI